MDDKKNEEGLKCEFTIPTDPRTKKNHQEIHSHQGKRFISTSKQYKQYAREVLILLDGIKRKQRIKEPINRAINVKAVYYMATRRRVDISNLHNALHDLLTESRIIEDDECKIVVSTDGSRVRYDKEHPRTEVVITKITDEEDLQEVENMRVTKRKK